MNERESMNERDVADLVRSEDRFVPPTPAQVARIRERALGGAGRHATNGRGEVVQLIGVEEAGGGDAPEPWPIGAAADRRPTRRIAVAAAIVVAIVGLGVAWISQSGDGGTASVQAVDDVVSVDACPAAVQALADGIDVWLGIDNWAAVVANSAYQGAGGVVEPDLAALALAALEEVGPDVDPAAVDRVRVELDALGADRAVDSNEASQPVRRAVALLIEGGTTCGLTN